MSEALPDPLVPSDVDLRGLEYMPFFGNHLFGSEFNARCTDSEWRAGVTIWWAAWNQVPAGSLPNDDPALARLADLGRDVKGWRKVKARALHGFIECSDGRLYHKFIAKQALIAWEKRVKEREKKRKWREGKSGSGDRDKHGLEPGQGPGQDRSTRGDGTADGTRRDVTGRDETGQATAASPAAEPLNRAAAIAVLLRNLEKARGKAPKVTSIDPRVQAWAEAGVTDEQLREAHALAVGDREANGENAPINAGFLDVFVTKVRTPSNGKSRMHSGPAKPWYADTWSALEAKAAELGLRQNDDEAPPYFRARVLQAAGVTEEQVRKAEADWR